MASNIVYTETEPLSQPLTAMLTPTSTSAPNRKVNRSCLECTRRKIKCDGHHPCGSCVYYKAAGACGYRQRSKRNAISRSTFDKTNEQLRAQSHILQTLFPGVSPDHLLGKSQNELLDLLPIRIMPSHSQLASHPSQSVTASAQPGLSASHPRLRSELPHVDEDGDTTNVVDDLTAVSESGEPVTDRQWDESLDLPANVASDDINAIGLATDQHARSYLGVTSMSAVFKAIFRLCPLAKQNTAQCARALAHVQAQVAAAPVFGRDPALGLLKEQRCIDFYFEHVHTIIPLLDEETFRNQYASGERRDSSWMGLLSMVFALGSIASGSDSLHEQYYREARSYVSLDSLGAGNLESLQALCLLGGLYLHYRNSPNMAYSVLGAAHRVAIALGLHREPRQPPMISNTADADHYIRRTETRRRTWWSLFCLDTWGSMTAGRPSCGRWDSNTMNTMLPQSLYPDDQPATSLQASARFCLICDRITHRFAQPARLSLQEIHNFDNEIEEWYRRLPRIVVDATNSPPRFNVAREFLRTRYHNVRLLLARSAILYVAIDLRRRNEQPMPELQRMLSDANLIASEAIDSIALYWTPNRIHVWNSGWYLFQACTVPLLSMAVVRAVPSAASPESISSWQAGLGKALEAFTEMRPWMRASDRSADIVSSLYEALSVEGDTLDRTPSATDGSLDLFGWCDDQLTELDWSGFLGEASLTQAVFPLT